MTLRRMKTYTGGQGYVYQYYFVGRRAALASDASAPATEFIFDVTSDRKTTFAVSVFLLEAAISNWAASHGRALTEAEQYAARSEERRVGYGRGVGVVRSVRLG